MDKFLVVGLGNRGAEYEGTRHNVGFSALHHWVEQTEGETFTTERYGDIARLTYRGRQCILLKPGTYVNLSGKAISYWLQKEKIPTERLFVLVDDLALPFGTIRLRAKGSDGGHNGIASINATIGGHYARLRFGIGNNFHRGQQVDYVLGKWTEEELSCLPERFDKMREVLYCFMLQGIDRAMSQYNNM